jgi:hypothetical protein
MLTNYRDSQKTSQAAHGLQDWRTAHDRYKLPVKYAATIAHGRITYMGSRRWLLLLALMPFVIDVTLTFAGQSPEYWQGAYDLADEGNPLARPFLAWHPWMFVALALAYALVVAAGIRLLSLRLAVWLATLIALGHVVGGCSWLTRHGWIGWGIILAYLVLAACFARVCWRRAS